jgi:hypothetical protein
MKIVSASCNFYISTTADTEVSVHTKAKSTAIHEDKLIWKSYSELPKLVNWFIRNDSKPSIPTSA